MKKLLAILCTATLLISSVFTGITVSANSAVTYLTPSSYPNYEQGTGITSSYNVNRNQDAVGNICFTAKVTTTSSDNPYFRLADSQYHGYGYAFTANAILFRYDNTKISSHTVNESYIGKTFVMQYKATVVDVDGDGLDDTFYELYINSELVCSDYVKDYIQHSILLCASKMSFVDYISQPVEITEIAPSKLYTAGSAISNNWTEISLNAQTENISITAAVTTGVSDVQLRFADKDGLGYGFKFSDNNVSFYNTDTIVTSAESTKGTYINTVFKMKIVIETVDSNMDSIPDTTNYKLYIDDELLIDTDVDNYIPSTAKVSNLVLSYMDLYDLYTLNGSSNTIDVADENDTKLALSDLGLLLGKHYKNDLSDRTNYGTSYTGSILNTVLEAKVMLENGGTLKYPADIKSEQGLMICVSGKKLLIKEADFDINSDGNSNSVLATITSENIGGAIIPATPFDLKIHINTYCDGGNLYNSNNKLVGTVDNMVTITYYINGYNVYSISLKGDVSYSIDKKTGAVLKDTIVIEGGPSLIEGRNLICVNKGEFQNISNFSNLDIKTPNNYNGMDYTKYTADKFSSEWKLSLNECFNTDIIIHKDAGNNIIDSAVGSLYKYTDGSLGYQLHINGSTKVYRLTASIQNGGYNYIGKQFNYKLTVENFDHDDGGVPNDLRIGVWIDNNLCNDEYLYADNCARKIGDKSFKIFKGAQLTAPAGEGKIESPSYEGYDVVTSKDFTGLNDGTYIYDGTNNGFVISNSQYVGDSFNGKIIKLKVRYNQTSNSTFFDIGNTCGHSLRFVCNSKNGGYAEQWIGNSITRITLPNLTPYELHDLAVAIDYIDGNVRFYIWIDNVYQGELIATKAGENVDTLTAVGVYSTVIGESVQLGEDVTRVIYKGEENIYFIEYVEGTTYQINGKEIEVSEDGYELCIKEPGEYILQISNEKYSQTKVIISYYEYDLNGDTLVNVLDFIAMMKNISEEQFSSYMAMAAAGKTSLDDVCKPIDLIAMKKFILTI